MELDRDGAQLFAGAGLGALDAARALAAALPQDEAGLRLSALQVDYAASGLPGGLEWRGLR